MITLDFDKPIRKIDGSPDDMSLGRLLAATLANQTKGDAIKLSDWAKALHKGESIMVDRADLDYLKNLINSVETLTVWSKSQFLEIMNSATDSKSK